MRGLKTHPLRWLVGVLPVVVLLVLFAPRPLGGSASYIIVAGASMTPTLEDGDLVVVRAGDYSQGEVIAFDTGRGVVIHRIVGGSAEEGFVMQGDNKPNVDTWRPTPDDVLGKQFIHIPGAGARVHSLMGSPMTLGVLFGGLGTFMIWTPKRRRRRRGAHASDKPRRSSRTARAPRPASGAGITLLVLTGLALVLSGLTIYLFSRPLEKVEHVERSLFEHGGTYAYTASVDPSVVYEGTTITPESTDAETTAIYTRLLNELQIDFSYELVSPGPAEITGEMSSELRIGAGENLWTRSIPLLPPETFEATTASGSFIVDVPQVLRMIDSAESQTGYTASSYQLTVVTRVDLVGEVGTSVDEVLVVELPMRLSDTVLSIDNELSMSQVVTASEERVVPNDLAILGISLPPDLIRNASGAALVAVLLAGIVYALVVRHRFGRGEVARIRLRYGPLIVPVTGSTPNGSHLVKVASMSDLARLARRAEQMVFYDRLPSGEHAFFVPDGQVIYQYRVRSDNGTET